MREPWEPFDPEGSPVRGEVVYDLRAEPAWLRRKLASYLLLMLVLSLLIMVGAGIHGLIAHVVWGAVTVVLGACYAAWWRAAVIGTRLRITTQEVVLERGHRGTARVRLADVRAITVISGGWIFGTTLATITVRRYSDGTRRRAAILLSRATEIAIDEAIDGALDRAQAPLVLESGARAGAQASAFSTSVSKSSSAERS